MMITFYRELVPTVTQYPPPSRLRPARYPGGGFLLSFGFLYKMYALKIFHARLPHLGLVVFTWVFITWWLVLSSFHEMVSNNSKHLFTIIWYIEIQSFFLKVSIIFRGVDLIHKELRCVSSSQVWKCLFLHSINTLSSTIFSFACFLDFGLTVLHYLHRRNLPLWRRNYFIATPNILRMYHQ